MHWSHWPIELRVGFVVVAFFAAVYLYAIWDTVYRRRKP